MINRTLVQAVLWCTLPLGIVVSFQACVQKTTYTSNNSKSSTNASGNGDAYSGKIPMFYHLYDTVNPCADQDYNGKPLPNSQIQYESSAAFLVREQCQDLTPKVIDPSQYTFSSIDNTITYNAQNFNPPPPAGDFDLVRSKCPAGMTEKTGIARTNLFVDSQNWFTTSWDTDPGVTLSMFGTISSLPSMLVQRTNPALLDIWRRPQQGITLQANTQYVSTYLIRAGSLSSALWKLALGSGGVEVAFDLANGTSALDWTNQLTNVSSTIRPLANGYIASVYFTTGNNVSAQAWIGVTPGLANATSGALNDSIYGTAAQLEKVSAFCQ